MKSKKHEVSTRTVVFAAIATFLAGFFGGWFAFGAEGVPGISADMVAAAGTWAIGLIAAKIALDAENARRSEIIRSNQSADAKRRAQLLIARGHARTAKVLHERFEELTGDPATPVNPGLILLNCAIALTKFEDIRLDDERIASLGIDDEAIQPFFEIRHQMLPIRDFVAQLTAEDMDAAGYSILDSENFKALQIFAKDMYDQAVELEGFITAEIVKLPIPATNDKVD